MFSINNSAILVHLLIQTSCSVHAGLRKSIVGRVGNTTREQSTQRAITEHGTNDIDTKIIGGAPSEWGEFPFYVHLGGCGGSLIAPRVVLTAGKARNSINRLSGKNPSH
jgi:hypothetical protein